jgi:hypothetical protein
MTETYSGELSEDTKRALLWIFDAAAGWQVRTERRAGDVHAGSSLWKDDEVTSPYLMSHSVRGALVSAVDHLNAFRALVQDAHVVHPRATLTLLRAALENAALAVWLLAPANRNERVLSGCGCSGRTSATGTMPAACSRTSPRHAWKLGKPSWWPSRVSAVSRTTRSHSLPPGRSPSRRLFGRPLARADFFNSTSGRPCSAGWPQAA